eukprot:TRINITY_DN39422_c0_g1_i1.p1 TRINITY_DN39422_c0_g1~~TRINITY_DN39422_c0_g1_i1.p1  ORF type:complete len:651 (+),score=219.61 TRINITY_DN39422_c0_g1_i1:90-1955(+)
MDEDFGDEPQDGLASWLGDADAALLEEDDERNKKQAKRNLRIRGLLQGRRKEKAEAEKQVPEVKPEALGEVAKVFETTEAKAKPSAAEAGLPPWFVCRDEPTAVSLRLHEELLDFAAFVRPTAAEAAARSGWLAAIEAAAKSLWAKAEVHIFGSSSTGLNLPSADVDIAISQVDGLRATTAMKQLAESLLEREEVSKVEIIQSAKVPVMKVQQRSTGLMADIVVNRTDGLETSRFIREQTELFPALAPLVLFLKLFLAQRGLQETFMGGMGSYLLVCVVLSFLQRHPSSRNPRSHGVTTLGNLLLDFFRYYGQEFRYAIHGISVLNGGSLFDRVARGWTATTRNGQPTLCLESPTETTVDIGSRVFKIGVVRAAFNHAYHVLAALMLSKEPHEGSLLCPHLLRAEHQVISQRYQLLQEQAPPLLGPVGRPDSDDEEAQEAKEEPPAKRARVEEGLSLSSEAGTSAQGEVAAAAAPEAEDSAMHDVMDFLAAADLCGAEALAAAVAEPAASEAEAGGAAPSQVETEDQPVKKPLKKKKAKKKAQKPVASTTAETAEATVEAPAEQEDEEALLQEQRSLQEQIALLEAQEAQATAAEERGPGANWVEDVLGGDGGAEEDFIAF